MKSRKQESDQADTNQPTNENSTQKMFNTMNAPSYPTGPLKYDAKRKMYYYGVSLDERPPHEQPKPIVEEENIVVYSIDQKEGSLQKDPGVESETPRPKM